MFRDRAGRATRITGGVGLMALGMASLASPGPGIHLLIACLIPGSILIARELLDRPEPAVATVPVRS